MPPRPAWGRGRRRAACALWRVLPLVLLGGARPPTALAWGEEGHAVIGIMAEQLLEPQARQRVLAILATDDSGLTADTGMGAEASWADHFRDSDRRTTRVHYHATRAWHFVDLELADADLELACPGPLQLAPGTPASSGPAADCIVHKIVQFRDELADPHTAPAERLLALQFLLHLVGDLHQPLHACDDHDQGGNAKWVETPEEPRIKLHALWDTEFVRRLDPDAGRLATTLLAELSPAERRRLGGGTPLSWALETWGVAREHAYGRLAPARADGSYLLSADDMTDATAVVRRQLQRAAVRLAELLNAALQ